MKKIFSILLTAMMLFPFTGLKNRISAENPKNTMAIAMATDNNYVLPTIVAMTSILENANDDRFYKFYLLISEDFKKENEEKFLNLRKIYGEKCLVNFLKMSNEFDNNRTASHITAATYFRLRLPSLLQNEEKCLYLDGDIIVLKDLWELYKTDITDYYIAGVKAAGPQRGGARLAKKLDTPDVKKYVNAGVLLMNLKKMRQDNIEQKFNEFTPRIEEMNLSGADQDTINSVCYEKIYTLPLKYNAMTKYPITIENGYKKSKACQDCYTRNEFEEAKTNPVIIHYADRKKPWNNYSIPFGDFWWEYAQKTDCFKEIQQKYMAI